MMHEKILMSNYKATVDRMETVKEGFLALGASVTEDHLAARAAFSHAMTRLDEAYLWFTQGVMMLRGRTAEGVQETVQDAIQTGQVVEGPAL